MRAFASLMAALALAAILTVGSAFAQDNPVVGVYDVAGKNPNGTNYIAKVEVVASGDTYELTWTDGGGNKSYGRGIFLNGMLAVGGVLGQSGFVFAMAQDDAGNLNGVWTDMASGTTLGGETWTRVP